MRLSQACACSGVSCSGSTVIACISTPLPAARIASRSSTPIRGHAERQRVKMNVSMRTLPRALVGVRTVPVSSRKRYVGGAVRGGVNADGLGGRRLGHERRPDAAQRTENQADGDGGGWSSDDALHGAAAPPCGDATASAMSPESGLSVRPVSALFHRD